MKKYLAVLLGVAMLLSLAACGNGNSNKSPAPEAGTESPETSAPVGDVASDINASEMEIVYMCSSLGDMSFADSGYRGVQEIAGKYGFKTRVVETMSDSSRYEAYILDVCDSGADFLVIGSTYQELVEKYAADYPDMRFIVFDTGREVEIVAENILYITFAQNEGSYLAGMIAAAVSENGVIGCVGGVQNPIIQDFMTGYMEGAKAYNPEIKVISAWVGNWSDSAKMLELCTEQNNKYGADVFFPIAGGAGTGAFEAALKQKNIWTIGVDSDQYAIFKEAGNEYADVIITSMLKEVGNSFVSVFDDYMAGIEYWGSVRTLGIAENSIGYVDNDMFKDNIPAEAVAKIEEAKAAITSGELTVKSYFDFANEQEYLEFANSLAP